MVMTMLIINTSKVKVAEPQDRNEGIAKLVTNATTNWGHRAVLRKEDNTRKGRRACALTLQRS
jgi:hypothetical protein